MKKFLTYISLVIVVMTLSGCSLEPSNIFTATGHLIMLDEDSHLLSNEGASKSNESATSLDENTVDLSSATISINQEITSYTGETQTIEHASGKFVDDTVKLHGGIDELTEVEVVLEIDSEKVLSTTALIGPGVHISFALIDVLEPELDRLVLYGASNRVQDPKSKFTIAGELQAIVKNDQLAIANFTSDSWNEKGDRETKNFGSVLLQNGSFQMEADVDEPTVVDIHVELLDDRFAHISGVAIVEPQTSITVRTRGSSYDLITSSKSELHSLLVESWQKNKEYQSKVDRAQPLYQKFIAEWQAQQAGTLEAGNTDASTEESPQDSSEDSDELAETDSSATSDIDVEISPADGCEHVDLANVRPSVSESFEVPEFRILEDEAWQIRVDTLEEIALNTEDPWIVLLALELGAFHFYFGDLDHSLRIHDELALKLDDDVRQRRLQPRRDMLASYIQINEKDKSLMPGQKAPSFTLPDIKGVEIELLDVLKSSDLVYIDFWASWCGPCIATFPALRKLYASYSEDGFEIVLISIDDTFEEWEEASGEHELPWMNVADIGGFDQDTPLAYGVESIPKAYLVDPMGCIVQKDLTADALEEILVERYGEVSESVESDANG